jgi:hypothetical protein
MTRIFNRYFVAFLMIKEIVLVGMFLFNLIYGFGLDGFEFRVVDCFWRFNWILKILLIFGWKG